MPGRSSSNSGSTGFISFSSVESALSSLKNFQSCISSGMDTASSVALDLVETQTEVSSEYSMDKAMVEFAMMDRELNHYVKAVQSAINHVKEERPEKIPDLKLLVEKKFLALQNKNSDADFQNNEKFVQFKQQLKELKKQCQSLDRDSPDRTEKTARLVEQNRPEAGQHYGKLKFAIFKIIQRASDMTSFRECHIAVDIKRSLGPRGCTSEGLLGSLAWPGLQVLAIQYGPFREQEVEVQHRSPEGRVLELTCGQRLGTVREQRRVQHLP
ncbi:E3 SUMO-protein ligase NSE2 [Pteropus alecto]|uniref:E3 SUMO-protein ligase NSE2 n=1 Tax=Pteropus alecto TaxID=9402 RepID=L5KB18_PTEAL|nr:E3 SUMO-protein ligase NSE2 [Pteropus alecto]